MVQWILRKWCQIVFLASVGLAVIILNRMPIYYVNRGTEKPLQLQTIEYYHSKTINPLSRSLPVILSTASTKAESTHPPSLRRTTNDVTMVTSYMVTPKIVPKNNTDLGLNDTLVKKHLMDYTARCNKLGPQNQTTSLRPPCECVPGTLVGRFNNSFLVNTLDHLHRKLSDIQRGGHWSPSNCTARERVAIIIPHMNRKTHLEILLNVLHPFLRRQQLDYRIFVAEQVVPDVFNKAATMNAGFLEASKLYQFDCVIFHDVDMLPEDDRNMYTCSENSPRHLGAYIDKFSYSFSGLGLTIGGVSAMKPSHFRTLNGFSNKFYGWGGEDDDTATRLRVTNLRLFRGPPFLARYTMLPHNRDTSNPYNQKRKHLLKKAWYGDSTTYSFRKDGLNSIQYELLQIDFQPLYTRLYISLPIPPTESQFLRVTDNLY